VIPTLFHSVNPPEKSQNSFGLVASVHGVREKSMKNALSGRARRVKVMRNILRKYKGGD